jgi:hypothetical protein
MHTAAQMHPPQYAMQASAGGYASSMYSTQQTTFDDMKRRLHEEYIAYRGQTLDAFNNNMRIAKDNSEGVRLRAAETVKKAIQDSELNVKTAKGEAKILIQQAENHVERLQRDVAEQISLKIKVINDSKKALAEAKSKADKAADESKARLAIMTARATEAENTNARLVEQIELLQLGETSQLYAPKIITVDQDSIKTSSSSFQDEETILASSFGHLAQELGLDNVDIDDEFQGFDKVCVDDVSRGGAFQVSPITSLAGSTKRDVVPGISATSSKKPKQEWMDGETLAMRAAFESRGTLINAIVVAMDDKQFKTDVDGLMSSKKAMPATFALLVEMLRIKKPA